jgi:hypothetical protein
MNSILYYSKYCEHSKKLLGYLTSNSLQGSLHFICIDKRTQDAKTGRMYIIMDNGETIIMPENIQSVPSVLLLNDNYRVIQGDDIYNHFKPRVEDAVRKSTQNNMEPSSFAFSGETAGLGVMSDSFSFLDQGADDLSTKGNGGTRQMYNYTGLDDSSGQMQTPTDDFNYQSTAGGGARANTMEQLVQSRENDISQVPQQRR